MTILPDVGRSKPAIMRSSVVLPQPEPPRRANSLAAGLFRARKSSDRAPAAARSRMWSYRTGQNMHLTLVSIFPYCLSELPSPKVRHETINTLSQFAIKANKNCLFSRNWKIETPETLNSIAVLKGGYLQSISLLPSELLIAAREWPGGLWLVTAECYDLIRYYDYGFGHLEVCWSFDIPEAQDRIAATQAILGFQEALYNESISAFGGILGRLPLIADWNTYESELRSSLSQQLQPARQKGGQVATIGDSGISQYYTDNFFVCDSDAAADPAIISALADAPIEAIRQNRKWRGHHFASGYNDNAVHLAGETARADAFLDVWRHVGTTVGAISRIQDLSSQATKDVFRAPGAASARLGTYEISKFRRILSSLIYESRPEVVCAWAHELDVYETHWRAVRAEQVVAGAKEDIEHLGNYINEIWSNEEKARENKTNNVLALLSVIGGIGLVAQIIDFIYPEQFTSLVRVASLFGVSIAFLGFIFLYLGSERMKR
jgi:hypothetical protein